MSAVTTSPPPIAYRRPSVDDIAPDGSKIRLLVGSAEAATRASLCEVTLEAGLTSYSVAHQTVEEIWYVLEGHGEVWRSEPSQPSAEPLPVGPGAALVIPTGWHFQFRASPAGPLRFLCYTSPPWPGSAEAKPVRSGPLGGSPPPTRELLE